MGQQASGATVVAGAGIVGVLVVAAIAVGSNMSGDDLPSRMPPDPNENLRVVRFEAEWRGSPVDRYMTYGIEPVDEIHRDEARISPWSATLTAEPGDRVWLVVSPDWSECRIIVEGQAPVEHEDEDCEVSVTVQ